jgi:hypothetical protein
MSYIQCVSYREQGGVSIYIHTHCSLQIRHIYTLCTSTILQGKAYSPAHQTDIYRALSDLDGGLPVVSERDII